MIRPGMGEAKRKTKRPCPALGQDIGTVECARKRNSQIECPLECPHNPFAPENYQSVYLHIEDRLISNLQKLLAKDLEPWERQRFLSAARDENIFLAHALGAWALHGTGRARRWKKQRHFRTWRNDDLVVLGCMESTRPALLEFQRVVDDTTCMALDLLNPEQGVRRVVDVSTAGTATRYRTVLTWIYDIPDGWRLTGSGVEVPTILPRDPAEVLDCVLDHLGAPQENRRDWLFENMALVADALSATGKAREIAGRHASDLSIITVTYKLRGFGDPGLKLLNLLDTRPGFEIEGESDDEDDDSVAVTILEPGSSIESPKGAPVIGTVFVSPSRRARLECVGKKSCAKARKLFEKAAGRLAVFQKETEDRRHIDLPSTPSDSKLVPPCLLENPPIFSVSSVSMPTGESGQNAIMVQQFQNLYSDFAGTPLPALDGLSPLEAAADPAVRPLLVKIMKTHLTQCDERRRHGMDVDIDDVLGELGLKELIQPPVPLGTPENDYEAGAVRSPSAAGAPNPVHPVLSRKDVEKRHAAIRDSGVGFEESAQSWPEIIDFLETKDNDDLSDGEFAIMLQSSVFTALTLHPSRPAGLKLDMSVAAEKLEEMLRHLGRIPPTGNGFNSTLESTIDQWAQDSLQPVVAQAALGMVIAGAEALPKRETRAERLVIVILHSLAVLHALAQSPPSKI